MNATLPPNPAHADIRLDIDTLDSRTKAANMTPKQRDELWTMVIAIGHAVNPNGDRFNPKISAVVTPIGRTYSDLNVPFILLSDLRRILNDGEVFQELVEQFEEILRIPSVLVTCIQFVDFFNPEAQAS